MAIIGCTFVITPGYTVLPMVQYMPIAGCKWKIPSFVGKSDNTPDFFEMYLFA